VKAAAADARMAKITAFIVIDVCREKKDTANE
jgi:hypothetical protein